MATWVNREVWWAVDRRRVVHVARVIQQDLNTEKATVLLDNGAHHEAPIYDLHLTKDAADLAVVCERDRQTGYML
jgi:hypothetical protein